jgi:hypothetical protein
MAGALPMPPGVSVLYSLHRLPFCSSLAHALSVCMWSTCIHASTHSVFSPAISGVRRRNCYKSSHLNLKTISIFTFSIVSFPSFWRSRSLPDCLRCSTQSNFQCFGNISSHIFLSEESRNIFHVAIDLTTVK